MTECYLGERGNATWSGATLPADVGQALAALGHRRHAWATVVTPGRRSSRLAFSVIAHVVVEVPGPGQEEDDPGDPAEDSEHPEPDAHHGHPLSPLTAPLDLAK